MYIHICSICIVVLTYCTPETGPTTNKIILFFTSKNYTGGYKILWMFAFEFTGVFIPRVPLGSGPQGRGKFCHVADCSESVKTLRCDCHAESMCKNWKESKIGLLCADLFGESKCVRGLLCKNFTILMRSHLYSYWDLFAVFTKHFSPKKITCVNRNTQIW